MKRLAALLLLAPLAHGQGDPAPASAPSAPERRDHIVWERDFDTAFARAAETHRPVLIAIMKDGEIGCTRMLEDVYRRREIIDATADFIMLPCSKYEHSPVRAVVNGVEMETCPVFPGVACGDHRKNETEMRARFQSSDTVIAPQHLVVDAERRILTRRVYEMRASEMVAFLADGRRVAGLEAKVAAESAPAAGASPPAAAEPALDPAGRMLLDRILTGSVPEKEQATREFLRDGDASRARILVASLPKLRSLEERCAVVRAAGYRDCAHAAPEMVPLLAAKEPILRNSAVVTLEEMENDAAAPHLLALREKEKDAEIQKDIVRALGPCGGGRPEVRAVLMKEIRSQRDVMRIAAILSLGRFLSGDDEVRKTLARTFAKDGDNNTRIAVLFAVSLSRDPSLASYVDELVKDEKNAQLRQAAAAVKGILNGEEPGAGPRGGGGGPGGRRGGGRWGFYRMLAPLFEKDRIERNILREFRRFGRP